MAASSRTAGGCLGAADTNRLPQCSVNAVQMPSLPCRDHRHTMKDRSCLAAYFGGHVAQAVAHAKPCPAIAQTPHGSRQNAGSEHQGAARLGTSSVFIDRIRGAEASRMTPR